MSDESLPAWVIDSSGNVWLIKQTTASDKRYWIDDLADPRGARLERINDLYGPFVAVGPAVVLVNPR